ncbi:acetyl-CoA C-acetyltransferase [Cupriavidus metallidurans]|uniref:Beta-ketoadipyl CoA thiolase n=1 Tax=Cupriavidus metallidurans (strain ATCC 43123 / DSM 2839 / NBRC 102507 / CH34) TaxID=266264 RepID=Q1LBV7_CUPMC|nr:acetyl-CoA C-acetyltransferase [Cupriavidus metallidurans]ABF12369.1 beta-ketoadipyl CoA thiolase [Cupriavidus metallidurans CH34]QGS32401.1 acetyl-CoA C-acetyltransferase [Cupriavidus metallidurans]
MNEAYIFDALRTPRGRGRADGSLYEVNPVDLLAGLMTELQQRHDLDTAQVEDALIGCVMPNGEQSGCIAKTAALRANWDWQVPGVQLDRYCGSGLETVNIAAAKVRSGWENLLVAGGVESMSRITMGGAPGPRDTKPDMVFQLKPVPTGVAADLMATLDGHTREAVDRYALQSQQRAGHARASGYFDRSVVPVKDANGLTILKQDELIREDTTLEKLGALKASFQAMGELGGFDALAQMKYPEVEKVRHIHTGGNSSGIVDGASLLLVGSEQKGRELGLTPRARVVSVAAVGAEPTIMLAGPAPASRLALKKAGLSIDDIDLIEVNEAFASVVLRFMTEMQVDPAKVNVNGGAIAMGHPLGATGGMLLGTLLDELERRNLKRGLITLCVAGGMGIATIIERV